MALHQNFANLSSEQKLADCYNLTLAVGPNPVILASLVSVTFTQRCGPFLRGETAGLLPAEAQALITAGFASLV